MVRLAPGVHVAALHALRHRHAVGQEAPQRAAGGTPHGDAVHVPGCVPLPDLFADPSDTLKDAVPCIDPLVSDAVVDAILAKRNLGTTIDMAPVVVAAGPGFTAGVDCHAVVETMRGHYLGRVVYDGSALPNTGVPGLIGGKSGERVLRAPADKIASSAPLKWRMASSTPPPTAKALSETQRQWSGSHRGSTSPHLCYWGSPYTRYGTNYAP